MSVKKLIYNEVARCQPASQQKNTFKHPPSCILPSFSLNTITISFRKYKRKVVIYLFNDDSSNSAFFMLNLAFANVKINLQCKDYKNILIRWDLTWCVFYVKKPCLREKTILKDFKRIIKSRNYLLSVNLSLKFWFSEAAVRRCVSK